MARGDPESESEGGGVEDELHNGKIAVAVEWHGGRPDGVRESRGRRGFRMGFVGLSTKGKIVDLEFEEHFFDIQKMQ